MPESRHEREPRWRAGPVESLRSTTGGSSGCGSRRSSCPRAGVRRSSWFTIRARRRSCRSTPTTTSCWSASTVTRPAASGCSRCRPASSTRARRPSVARRASARRRPASARRELVPLGWIWTTPGFTDERIWLFLARGLRPGRQDLQDDEALSVERMAARDAGGARARRRDRRRQVGRRAAARGALLGDARRAGSPPDPRPARRRRADRTTAGCPPATGPRRQHERRRPLPAHLEGEGRRGRRPRARRARLRRRPGRASSSSPCRPCCPSRRGSRGSPRGECRPRAIRRRADARSRRARGRCRRGRRERLRAARGGEEIDSRPRPTVRKFLSMPPAYPTARGQAGSSAAPAVPKSSSSSGRSLSRANR